MIAIRPFLEKDLDPVFQIEQKNFSTPWSKNSFASFLKDPFYCLRVATVNNSVAGYFVAQIIPPEAELHNIAVDPDFQRQGVASKMLKYFINNVSQNDVHEVFLMLRESNHAAQKLYKTFGFTLCDHRPHYYQNPSEGAQILHKKLDTKA